MEFMGKAEQFDEFERMFVATVIMKGFYSTWETLKQKHKATEGARKRATLPRQANEGASTSGAASATGSVADWSLLVNESASLIDASEGAPPGDGAAEGAAEGAPVRSHDEELAVELKRVERQMTSEMRADAIKIFGMLMRAVAKHAASAIVVQKFKPVEPYAALRELERHTKNVGGQLSNAAMTALAIGKSSAHSSVEAYLEHMQQQANDLEKSGQALPDSQIIMFIDKGLPEEYQMRTSAYRTIVVDEQQVLSEFVRIVNGVTRSIKTTRSVQLKTSEAASALLAQAGFGAEVLGVLQHNVDGGSSVHYSGGGGGGGGGGGYRGKRGGRGGGRGAGAGNGQQRRDTQGCFVCGSHDHRAAQCPRRFGVRAETGSDGAAYFASAQQQQQQVSIAPSAPATQQLARAHYAPTQTMQPATRRTSASSTITPTLSPSLNPTRSGVSFAVLATSKVQASSPRRDGERSYLDAVLGRNKASITKCTSTASTDAPLSSSDKAHLAAAATEIDEHALIIDSGCSKSMSNKPSLFDETTLVPLDAHAPWVLSSASGHQLVATHVGTIDVPARSTDGSPVRMRVRDALLVPSATGTLISLAAIQDDLHVDFERLYIEHRATGARVAMKKTCTGLFVVEPVEHHSDAQASVGANLATATTTPKKQSTSVLWHNRLGHAGRYGVEQTMSKLGVGASSSDCIDLDAEDERGAEAPTPSTPWCSACVSGKATRPPIPSRAIGTDEREKQFGGRVSMDIVGPMKPDGRNSERFFLTMYDEATMLIAAYTLRHKSEAYDAVESFCHTIGTPRTLLSDQDAVFKSERMKRLCATREIQQLFSTVYRPEQNGAAERANRTVLDAARTMLAWSELPKEFWPHAVEAAAYVRNRTPRRALNGQTPIEALRAEQSPGKYTSASDLFGDLHTWGCGVMVNVPAQQRQNKWSARAEEGVFIGWTKGQKAFNVLVPKRNAIVVSRDVQFDESAPGGRLVSNENIGRNEGEWVVSSSSVAANALGSPTPTSTTPTSSDNGRTRTNAPTPRARANAPPPPPQNAPPQQPLLRIGVDEEEHSESALDMPAQPYVAIEPMSEPNAVIDNSDSLPVEFAEPNAGAPFAADIDRGLDDEPDVVFRQPAALSTTTTATREPRTLREALSGPDAKLWRAAMIEELDSMKRLDVFRPLHGHARPPASKGVVDTKWVFKLKRNEAGEIVRYKARLVVRGYTQVAGRDFLRTYAAVAEAMSVRTVLALAVLRGWGIFQIDVRTAYLNAPLDVDLYVKSTPEMREAFDAPTADFLQMLRAVYGAKQSALCWSETLGNTLERTGLTRSHADPCVWSSSDVVLVIFVDDLIITFAKRAALDAIVAALTSKYDITTDPDASLFVGLQLERTPGALKIHQRNYLEELVERTCMMNARPRRTPMETGTQLPKLERTELSASEHAAYQSLVGSLMYAATMTRPDISFAVGMLARHMLAPGHAHMHAAKHVVAYVASTLSLGVVIAIPETPLRNDELRLSAFADADHANDVDDRRSTSGYVIGLYGVPVEWRSEKQSLVLVSTAQAEYVALCRCVERVRFVVCLVEDIVGENEVALHPVTLTGDNQASMFWATSPKGVKPCKPIHVRERAVSEAVSNGEIELRYAASRENVADIFTKALGATLHESLRAALLE